MRDLGRVPARALRLAVRDRAEELWAGPPNRERWFRVHAETRSVLLIWSEHRDFPSITVARGPWRERLDAELRPVLGAIGRHFPGGLVANLMLACLPGGGRIPVHVDAAPFFAAAHRLHVPLFTHAAVSFSVDGTVVPFAASHLYEIDNRRPHEVHNAGNADRIHLIADVLAPEHA